jgi:hypothetical protein
MCVYAGYGTLLLFGYIREYFNRAFGSTPFVTRKVPLSALCHFRPTAPVLSKNFRFRKAETFFFLQIFFFSANKIPISGLSGVARGVHVLLPPIPVHAHFRLLESADRVVPGRAHGRD